MNYMKGFLDLEKQRQLFCEPASQKDSRTGRYKGRQVLSSGSVWDSGSLDPSPGMVGMLTSGQDPSQPSYCLCLCLLSLSKNQGAGVMGC